MNHNKSVIIKSKYSISFLKLECTNEIPFDEIMIDKIINFQYIHKKSIFVKDINNAIISFGSKKDQIKWTKKLGLDKNEVINMLQNHGDNEIISFISNGEKAYYASNNEKTFNKIIMLLNNFIRL